MAQRIRVAVVFGGRSTEHAISCVTAGSVLAAMDPARYDVVPVGISRAGRWVLSSGEPSRWAITNGVLPEVPGDGSTVVLSGDPTAPTLLVRDAREVPQELGAVDVVLPLLHGAYGEDGTLQGLLDLAGVPYVGSGVFASAAAMDKIHAKALLTAAGLPVRPWLGVTSRSWSNDRVTVLAAVAELGFPVFVKPSRAGSSVGITKVRKVVDVPAAIEAARAHDPRVIVEAFVAGREIECGVLEGVPDRAGSPSAPDCSVVGEILVQGGHDFYDFEAKYLDCQTGLVVPADLPVGVVDKVRKLAAAAFDALGCEGLARVDFFLDGDELVINEVNTMPGFTPASMFPQLWAASGLDYRGLVDRMIATALAKPMGLRG